MPFKERLAAAARRAGNLLCLGLDPDLERIPLRKGGQGTRVQVFCTTVLDALEGEDALPAAVKPNYGFFAQYGMEGLRALRAVIARAKQLRLPVILDAKHGDIASSSEAYARACFSFWGAHAVTVHPYTGFEALAPFASAPERACYVLVRTSNPGALDLQGAVLRGDRPLYEETALKTAAWHRRAPGVVGAVAGATALAELENIAGLLKRTAGEEFPLLVPGVGAQGGDAAAVRRVLEESGLALPLQRVNASRAILYAWQETGEENDYAGAAAKAARALASALSL